MDNEVKKILNYSHVWLLKQAFFFISTSPALEKDKEIVFNFLTKNVCF